MCTTQQLNDHATNYQLGSDIFNFNLLTMIEQLQQVTWHYQARHNRSVGEMNMLPANYRLSQ